MLKLILIVLALLILAVGAGVVFMIGPRNIIGMLRYDQRREGTLGIGDAAPDVELVALDGATRARVRDHVGSKPLVLIFGSFT